MKILYVLEHYYPYIGGVEKLFKNLAESVIQNGNEAIVITSRFDKSLPQEENINGVVIKRLNVNNRFLFTFFSIGAIIRASKNCDLIHTTSYNAALPAFIASKITRKKIVITFHEVWGKLWFSLPFIPYVNRILYFLFEQFILLLKFNMFIAVSDYTKDKLIKQGIQQQKVIRIYNGIDYNQFNNNSLTDRKIFYYTYFGRLGSSKGLDLLLKASEIFMMRHKKDVHLKLIIPKLPKTFYKKILKLVKNYKIQYQTIIYHNLSEEKLKKELLASSCVVVPSYNEGFCFSAVEAIAMGIPVILSNQGALKEIVSGKYIFIQRQDTNNLLEALEKAKKEEWITIPIKKFELNEQIKKYERLYSSLL